MIDTAALTPQQRADDAASERGAFWRVTGWEDGLATCEKRWQRTGGLPDGYKKARLRCLAIPVGPPGARYHGLVLGDEIEVLEQR